VEFRGNDVTVVVGALKLTVPMTSVRRVAKRRLGAADRAEVVQKMGDQPELEVKREVDVRGMRVSEVDDAVQQAVDLAVRGDLPVLMIIHGKGTGALRERVTALLKGDKRVRDFRLGLWNEGGAGVTIVTLSETA
jgi:DNA mismatch repair protein MutS2